MAAYAAYGFGFPLRQYWKGHSIFSREVNKRLHIKTACTDLEEYVITDYD
jgi:hypothetical protein